MKKKFIQLLVLLALWMFVLPYAFIKVAPAMRVLAVDAITASLGMAFMKDSFKARPKIKTMFLCVIMCIVLLVGEYFITGMLFSHFGIGQTTNDAHLNQVSQTGPIAYILAACVAAPMVEEIIFRGFIFEMINELCARKHIGATPAYIVSAGLFAVMHAPSNWVMAVPYFLSGLIFAIAYDHGSIHSSILVHIINNSLAIF